VAPRVLLITDPAFGDETILRCVAAVAGALPRGAFGVQLRDKQRARVSLRSFALALRVVTRREGAWLIVNGDAKLARDVGADGVHLGGDAVAVADARGAFGRPTWISVATHSDTDVKRAVTDGADAVLVSPIFPTRSPSPLAPPKRERGLGALRSARMAVRAAARPPEIYALGGVTAARAGLCAESGADGVAVLGTLLSSRDPAAVARAIHDALPMRW
jgi:thiamine-phosphate pyrophosphorylase